MAVSKKIRFEIFKRDNFKCGYCGKTPPEVILEIDHINPVSKGGKDDINNLITACFDCNRGKKHIPLQTIPAPIKENLEILREKELQLKEYNKAIKKIEAREKHDIEKINKIYSDYQNNKYEFSDTFKNVSLKRFLRSLPVNEIEESLYIAINNVGHNPQKVIPYFCGVCWNKINGTVPRSR